MIHLVMAGKYVYQISDEAFIDVDTISDQDMKRIKKDVKFFMQSKQFTDPAKAYLAAFIIYIYDMVELATPYDPKTDKFM